MFVIDTLADIRCLREARVVPDALLDEIGANLHDVHNQIGGGVPLEEFSLAVCGPTVILQSGDGPGAYRLLGFPDGPVESRPEWVGRGNFGGQVIYQVIVLRGNDRAVSLYIPAAVLDADTTARLDADASNAPPPTTGGHGSG